MTFDFEVLPWPPVTVPLTVFPKGMQQTGFRDGGARRLPDAGPDPTDVAPTTPTARAWQPERRLVQAVLEAAIDDFLGYAAARDPQGRALHHAAADWIASRAVRWPYAFENCCTTLHLDPDAVRDALRRRVAERRRRPRPAAGPSTPRSDSVPSRTVSAATA